MVKSKELCLRCTKENTYLGKYFCGEECEEWVIENGMYYFNLDASYVIRMRNLIYNLGPCIFKLSKNGNKFKDISNQFISSWKHKNKPIPKIHTIYKIFLDKE